MSQPWCNVEHSELRLPREAHTVPPHGEFRKDRVQLPEAGLPTVGFLSQVLVRLQGLGETQFSMGWNHKKKMVVVKGQRFAALVSISGARILDMGEKTWTEKLTR